jgi:myo-inositol-1(or 4)-monophosphatase
VAVLAQAVVGELGQSEVEHLDVAVAAQHQVLRLDVAVDDARLVRGRERARGADADVQHVGDRHLLAADLLAQRLAVDVLGGDVVDAVGFADVVDGDDVGMVQRRGRAGLALEAADALLVLGEAHRQELERHLAPQTVVLGEINLAHAAGAEKALHPVVGDLLEVLHGLGEISGSIQCRAVTNAEIAREAARRGAEVLLRYWERLGREDADLKSRNDWVSDADRESETAIIDSIRARCPRDAFLGEESGTSGSTTGERTWIIDPLDGTSNYLQHFPFWSVSIALRQGDELIAGVIYEPLRDLFFTAERGAGAFRDHERMHVSDQATLDGAFVATGFPFRAQSYVSTYVKIFEDVIRKAKGVRRAGSAALDLAYTAAGIFDGFFEMHLAAWDVAAGALLVTEAGGKVTDFSGGDRWLGRGNIVGAAPGLHAELIEVIGRHTNEEALDHRAASRVLPNA